MPLACGMKKSGRSTHTEFPAAKKTVNPLLVKDGVRKAVKDRQNVLTILTAIYASIGSRDKRLTL